MDNRRGGKPGSFSSQGFRGGRGGRGAYRPKSPELAAAASQDQSGYESGEIMPTKPLAHRRSSGDARGAPNDNNNNKSYDRDFRAREGGGRFGGRGRGRGGRSMDRGRGGGRHDFRPGDTGFGGNRPDRGPPREDRGISRPMPPRESSTRSSYSSMGGELGSSRGQDFSEERFAKRPREDLGYQGDYEEKRPRGVDYGPRGRPSDTGRDFGPPPQSSYDDKPRPHGDMRRPDLDRRSSADSRPVYDGPPRREDPILSDRRGRPGADTGYKDSRSYGGPSEDYRGPRRMDEPRPSTYRDDRGPPPPTRNDNMRDRLPSRREDSRPGGYREDPPRRFPSQHEYGGEPPSRGSISPRPSSDDGLYPRQHSGPSMGHRDGPRDMPRDSPRDLPPRDLPRDGMQHPRDRPTEPQRDMPREMIHDRERLRDPPRDIPRDMPRDIPRDRPRDGPREPPRDFRDMPRDSRDLPRDIPRDREPPRDLPRNMGRPRDPFREAPREGPRTERAPFREGQAPREFFRDGPLDRPRDGFSEDMRRPRDTYPAREAPRESFRDGPGQRDAFRDGFRDGPRDGVRDGPRDGFREGPRDGPRDIPRDRPRDMPPRDGPRDMPRESARDFHRPRDGPDTRDFPRDMPHNPMRDGPRPGFDSRRMEGDGYREDTRRPVERRPEPMDVDRNRDFRGDSFRGPTGHSPKVRSKLSWVPPQEVRSSQLDGAPMDQAPSYREDNRGPDASSRNMRPYDSQGMQNRNRDARGDGQWNSDRGRFDSGGRVTNDRPGFRNEPPTSSEFTFRNMGGDASSQGNAREASSTSGQASIKVEAQAPKEEVKPAPVKKEPEPKPIVPPEPSQPSGIVLALSRLAELECQMEYAYVKYLQLMKRQQELKLQSDLLKTLPVGIDAIREELDAQASSSEQALVSS